ncbi:MAG: hypothetical protein AB7U30_07720 [Sulfuricellaceae bacterium]|jgi:hypothetical protein
MAYDRDLGESSPRRLVFKLVMLVLFSAVALLGVGPPSIPFIAGFIGLAFAVEFFAICFFGCSTVCPRSYLRSVGEHRLYSYCGSDVRVLGKLPKEAWFSESDILAALMLAPPPALGRFSATERVKRGGGWYLSAPGVERLLRYYVKPEEASRFRSWLQRDVFLEKVAR